MKALKFILFLLFLSPVSFIGCNNEDNIVDPPADIKVIVPLKVGNSWTYETTTYDTSGNIISTNIDSFSVISDSLINGRKTYMFSTGGQRFNNETGFWITIFPDDSLLLYKYPASVGDLYSTNLKVICKDSSISIPNASYKCYGYSSPVAIDYVSPGIGLIREEWYKKLFDGSEYLYQKQELLDYTLQ